VFKSPYFRQEHSQRLFSYVTGMENYIFMQLLHYFLNRTLGTVISNI
jgi:hypothetical protein